MATLEQLEEGIRRAHAAGNAEHVQALGAAYRQMQSQAPAQPVATAPVASNGGSVAPEGLRPGTREYADWAAETARQQVAQRGQANLPQVSDMSQTGTQSSVLDPLVQGVTFGWGDELRGAVQGGLAAAQGGDFGSTYDQVVDESRNSLDRERRVNPIGSFAAEMAGAIPTGAGLGGQVVARGATLGARALSGGLVAAGQGAAYGAGSAQDDQRGTGAMIGGTVGGAFGAAAPYLGAAARRVITPSPASASQTAAARLMAGEGVTLTAGQQTGNKGMQYLESELGKGVAADMMERQSEEFTSAVLRRIGVNATRATPDVVDAAYTAIGQQFDNVAAVTNTPFDATLQNNLLNVATDYLDTAANPAPVVDRMVNRLGELARVNGGRVTGQVYQNVRSELGRLSRNADPTTRAALRELQEALDDGVQRHLSGQTLQAWQDARRAYQNFLVVERAVTSAGQNAASGLISPAQLRSAAVNQNRRSFARGNNDFARLANAAVQTMTPLPQSGTAPRLAAQTIAGIPAAIGAAAGSPMGLPGMIAGGVAGAAIPAVAGRAMLSGPGRRLLSNQFAAGPQAGLVERSLRSTAPLLGAGIPEPRPLEVVVSAGNGYSGQRPR